MLRGSFILACIRYSMVLVYAFTINVKKNICGGSRKELFGYTTLGLGWLFPFGLSATSIDSCEDHSNRHDVLLKG